MPIGETFWNPYRFVPARETINRRRPITDERFDGLSGRIDCTLTNLTLLLVAGGQSGQQRFIQRDQRPFVPGSSLKGMLRALAEIVGGGCFPFPVTQKCRNSRNLCVACRMYGMLDQGNVHKGKVSPSDGLLLPDQQVRRKQVGMIQGQPKRAHRAFYRHPLTGGDSDKMMKMYFHQPRRTEAVLNIPDNLKHRAVNKEMLLPGHTFQFTVPFENLAQDELDLLLYTLVLEEHVEVTLTPRNQPPIKLSGPLRHKLGNGKAQGPGTCHIQVHSLTLLPNPEKRFRSLKRQEVRVLSGSDLKAYIETRTQSFRNDNSPTMQFLRKMMVWDPRDSRDFRYPDYQWFQTKPSVPLKSI